MDGSIQNLIDAGEGYRIEFKESLEKSFVEEVCAFANSRGGYLILTTQNWDLWKTYPNQLKDVENK